LCLSLIFYYESGDHRALHSFPTRRSSDLSLHGRLTNWPGLSDETDCRPLPRTLTQAWRFIMIVAISARFEIAPEDLQAYLDAAQDRKSTRLNSSHVKISYAVFCLKKKKQT